MIGLSARRSPIKLECMTLTIELSENGQFTLPKAFCEKNQIKAGTALRVVEVGKGLYVTAQEEPNIEELERLIAESGAPDREPTPEEEKMLQEIIADVRRERRGAR